MATLKAVVRKQRADGLYPVYIRIGHRTKQGYIKTNKVVGRKQIAVNGDIKDPVVNEYCTHCTKSDDLTTLFHNSFLVTAPDVVALPFLKFFFLLTRAI